jgi:hypothetical protein
MSQKAVLEEGIKKLSEGFQLDGADLQLTDWNNGRLEVTLIFGPDVCQECIVPKDVIKMMVQNTLSLQVSDLQDVVIIDPRD